MTEQGISEVTLRRLQTFRCLLNRRGIPAAPVLSFWGTYVFGRVAPSEPGSCFSQ
jgi:hexosaminidase